MRPPGPEPLMVCKSIPASRARRRFAGDVMTRPVCATAAFRAGGGDDGADTGGEAGAAGGVATGNAAASAAVSKIISGEPTATLSPGSPVMETTRPLTG